MILVPFHGAKIQTIPEQSNKLRGKCLRIQIFFVSLQRNKYIMKL